MSDKVYNIINNQILEKLKTGVIPWRHPWTAGAPKNAVSKKSYTGFNVFRLAFETYKNPNWATIKQINHFDGRIIKGEKSTQIIFWRMNKYEDKDSGEEKTIPMLRYYNVWNVEQTDLIDDDRFKVVKNDNDPIEACQTIIDNYQDKPVIVNKENARAYYDNRTDLVNMPELAVFDTSEDFYSVQFHELTHSTAHPNRLARFSKDYIPNKRTDEYKFEEIIAELGAAYLSGITNIGYHTQNNSASYIDGYINALKKDPKMFIKAASKAQKAVEYIQGVEAA